MLAKLCYRLHVQHVVGTGITLNVLFSGFVCKIFLESGMLCAIYVYKYKNIYPSLTIVVVVQWGSIVGLIPKWGYFLNVLDFFLFPRYGRQSVAFSRQCLK